ncbi:MAG: hypothetical protein P4L71_04180 [Acetobacteraceae bacterium]|nr:hypothetical protein [Acetobacteraceae bacterium]
MLDHGDYVLVCLVGIACLLYPVLDNTIPPLMDYPGHLSRVYILYDLLHDHIFGEMYQYRFVIVPNLAVDGICLGLMELGLSAEISGRVFVAITVVVMAGGVLAWHYAIFRRWSCCPMLIFPFIYHDIFFYGFINYFFGIGVAFLGAAIWRLNEGRRLPGPLLILLLFSILLFFSHLMALLIMVGLIVGRGLGSQVLRRHRSKSAMLRLLAGAAVGLLPLGLLAFAPLLGESSPLSFAAITRQLSLAVLVSRFTLLRNVTWGYDHVTDLVSLACLAVIAGYVLLVRALRVDLASVVPFVGLIAVYLIVPEYIFGTSYAVERLPIVIFMTVVGSTDMVMRQRWERIALPGLLVALSLLRGAAVESAWARANAAFSPLLAALDRVPAYARIYSANAVNGTIASLVRMPFGSLPGYAVIRRNAYFSGTFAIPSQNLVVRQPRYAAGPPTPGFYHAGQPTTLNDPHDPYTDAQLAFYDYALIINPELWPNQPPANLKPVVAGPGYTLFAIARTHVVP